MILVELEYKGILQKVKVKPLVYVRTSFVLRRPFTVDLIISKPPGGDPDIVLVEEPNHVDQSLLAMFGLDLNDPGHCGREERRGFSAIPGQKRGTDRDQSCIIDGRQSSQLRQHDLVNLAQADLDHSPTEQVDQVLYCPGR